MAIPKMNGKSYRTPAAPVESLPGDLPMLPIAEDVDEVKIVTELISKLNKNDLTNTFSETAFWRDHLSLTGTRRTFYRSGRIVPVWGELAQEKQAREFSVVEGSSHVVRHGPMQYIEVKFTFVSTHYDTTGRSSGVLRIIPTDAGGWKIWVLVTILESIDELGDPDVFDSGMLQRPGPSFEDVMNGEVLDALVAGAGNAGLCMTGRLKALGLRVAAAERYEKVGMSWTERYKSLKLHTPKPVNILPFENHFPEDAPHYLTMQDLADYYRSFVDKYQLSVWGSTEVVAASWDDASNTWTVNIRKEGVGATVRARHLVFCTGPTGRIPYMPEYANREAFKGEVRHSLDYSSSRKWAGKKGIVIGSANTAFDVVDDMHQAGMASVTMVQRKRTAVMPVEYLPPGFSDLGGKTVHECDNEFHSMPVPISRLQGKAGFQAMAGAEPERFDALEEKGFALDRDVDLVKIIYEHMGGHYLDVGQTKLILDGSVKVKSGAVAVSYTSNGLAFDDGTTLEADVIVFATGFEGNMRNTVSKIVEPVVAERLDDFWHLDGEGEPIGVYKPIGHANIWYCGGDIGLSRFFSRFAALQIGADLAGKAFVPYID